MYGKDKIKTRYSILYLFYSVLFLFVSCEFNQPVRDYLEYWSSTCQVGKIEYASENVFIDDVPNLSASEPIEINLYTVNPKSIRILCKDSNNFSLQNEAGDLSVTNYSETMVDPTYVKIRANLSDASEGQLITLSGCLWPENRLDFPEADLRASSPELFYTTSFIQNTPPDNIKNLHRAEDYFPETHKCYISFEVPDQSLNRNMNSTYEVKYYFREDNGSLEYKGSKVLTLADNKNPSAGSDVFMYYFDGQNDNFLNCYEYTVQVTGPRGLTVGLRATDPALGACVLVEPSITVLDIPNGLYDEDSDGDYECYEVASDGDVITFTALPGQEGDTLTVTDNGTEMTATSGSTYTVSGSGQHEIKATSSRTDAFSVTLTKRIRIETTPAAAVFSFGMPFNGEGEDDDGYEYIEVSSLDTNPSFTITSPDSGTTFSGSIDGADFSERSEPKTGNLFVTSHILEAEVHKPYCNPVSSQKKVCVAKSLTDPTITFNPSTACNGNTDSDGYEYYEIASSSVRLGYTIEPVSYDKNTNGAKVSGSIGSTTFTETVKKTGDLGTGTYTISVDVKRKGMISKHYEKKIKVVEALKEPTYSSTPDFNGNTVADFDYVEVSSSSGTVTLTINAATGCTIAGTHSIDSATGTSFNSSSNSYVTLTLGLGNHIITGNVSRTNYTSKSFTKKIKVVESLKDPAYTCSYLNGKTNDGYEIIEIPATSTSAAFTITAANPSGCTITGTDAYTPNTGSSSSSNFNSNSSNSVTLTLGLGTHNISGTVSNSLYNSHTFTKKVKVVHELQEPTYTSTPDFTGKSLNGFECVEVSSSSGTADLTITAATGSTITGSYGSTSFNSGTSSSKTITLGIGEYTISGSVNKTGYTSKSFTKKIKVIQELQEPTIYLTSDGSIVAPAGTPEASSYMLYTAYNVYLNSDGSGGTLGYSVSPNSADTGATVKVEECYGSTSEIDSSGSLALGPHKIKCSVSKDGYVTREFDAKWIYVQGILAPAKIQYSAKKSGSNPVWTEMANNSSTQNLQFSYISYDTMPVKVSPGNEGNEIAVSLEMGNSCIASCGKTTSDFVNDHLIGHGDNVYTITVYQSRQYCISSETVKRKFTAKIKPITLTYEAGEYTDGLQVEVQGFDGNAGENMCIRGEIYVKGPNTDKEIWHYQDSYQTVTRNQWSTICDTDAAYKYWRDTFNST
ncbi:MAG: hypothetical protein VZR56_10265 [Treponema sp.]|nr:hypothetical protein [Treponema sp.]